MRLASQFTNESRNLLSRYSGRQHSSLTEAQLQMDALGEQFSHEASDFGNLIAMSVGGLAFKATRSAFVSAGIFRPIASMSALAFEATAYRASSNAFSRLQGHGVHETIFDSRGWLTTYFNFGALKFAGNLVEGRNVFLRHGIQSTAMVATQQALHYTGFGNAPEGSLLQQFVSAETSNLAMEAGGSLVGFATGHRFQILERALDLRAEAARYQAQREITPFTEAPALMAAETSLQAKVLTEAAVSDAWKTHLQKEGAAGIYLNRNPEAQRLLRALQSVDANLSGRGNQKDYLNAVLRQLRTTQGVSNREYNTRYSVLEAAGRFDAELLPLVGESEGVVATFLSRALEWAGVRSEVKGLYARHLARYRVEVCGGEDWGVKVNEGKPHQALEKALALLATDESGQLRSVHEGRSLEDRLREARQILDEANVRVVTVWGAGRHGLALGDWVRQAASRTEMIDGKYVIPIMLGHRADFTHELNIDGSNEKNLPNMPINEPGRLALRAAMPEVNKAYLALSETVVVTLPSDKLKKEFTQEVVRNLSGNTQLIFAIKSVLDKGESVPGYVMEQLATWRRYDLMLNAAFQSGLGFPKEMFGRLAPDAPVNLAVDAMIIEAAVRAAKTLIGDRAQEARVGPNKVSLQSYNKRIDAGVLVFKGAYGGFIKNFIAPWVGKRFMDYYVSTVPTPTVAMMRSKLAELQDEAVGLSERIFRDFEAAAIRKEAEKVERILSSQQGGDEGTRRQREEVLEWTRKVRDRLDKYRDRVTATEDLLGYTRIRDMDVYLRLVGDLIAAKGLTFERRFGELTSRVRSQASSGNFAYGLLEPIYLELIRRGMLVKRPVRDFTVEGITGIRNALLRWGTEPDFVKETLAWVNPDPEPLGHPKLHASGLRRHALRVTRDFVDEMLDHDIHVMMDTTMLPKEQRDQIQQILDLGKEMILRLRREKSEFPPMSDEIRARIEGSLLSFERFFVDTEARLRALTYEGSKPLPSLRSYAGQYRKMMNELRTQLAASEEWIEPEALERMEGMMKDALAAISPK